MEKIKFTPTREALLVFAIFVPICSMMLFFRIRDSFFSGSFSLISFLAVTTLIIMFSISLFFLTKKPSLTLDESGLYQTGIKPHYLSWDEIAEVKNHFILSQDFISIRLKARAEKNNRWVHIYVRPYSAGADVLVNFMQDMAKLPADQRKGMMHNLDWVL